MTYFSLFLFAIISATALPITDTKDPTSYSDYMYFNPCAAKNMEEALVKARTNGTEQDVIYRWSDKSLPTEGGSIAVTPNPLLLWNNKLWLLGSTKNDRKEIPHILNRRDIGVRLMWLGFSTNDPDIQRCVGLRDIVIPNPDFNRIRGTRPEKEIDVNSN